MNRARLRMAGAWGLGLLLILLLFILGDASQLVSLPEIHWGALVLLFVSNAGFTIAHNFRWKGIVENLSPSRPIGFFTLYRFLIDSYAIGKVIPMDVSLLGVRSYYLSRLEGSSVSIAVFSVLLDRFLDVIIFLSMALPSFLLITRTTDAISSFLILALLLVGQGVVLSWKKGESFRFLFSSYRFILARWGSKIPFLRNRMKGGIDVTGGPGQFTFRSVIKIMTWNYIKYIFLSLRFFLTGQALGISFPIIQSFFFLPFVQLSGLINVTPGGIGVVEAVTYGALLLMGLPTSQILIFIVGQRVLLTAMFVSLFVLNRLFYFVYSKWRREESLSWR